jgi:hypothetical protein
MSGVKFRDAIMAYMMCDTYVSLCNMQPLWAPQRSNIHGCAHGPFLLHACCEAQAAGCVHASAAEHDQGLLLPLLPSTLQIADVPEPTWSNRSFASASTSSSWRALLPPAPPLLPLLLPPAAAPMLPPLLPPMRGARLSMPASSALLSSMR